MINLEVLKNDKNKKYVIIAIVIAVGIACWGMFSWGIPDIGSGINKTRAELEQARAELDVTNRRLSESNAIAEDLRRTITASRAEVESLRRENSEVRELINSVRSTNNELAEQLSRNADLTDENLRLVRESQRGLKTVRETGERRNP